MRILGCELGDSLPISGRIVQSLGRSLSEMGDSFWRGLPKPEGGWGYSAIGMSVRESSVPWAEEGS